MVPDWRFDYISWEWPRRLTSCLLEAQAGPIKHFCPMKLTSEFGLDHNPAVSSTFAQPAVELMGFHVTYWLKCNSPSTALKILHVISPSTETRSHL